MKKKIWMNMKMNITDRLFRGWKVVLCWIEQIKSKKKRFFNVGKISHNFFKWMEISKLSFMIFKFMEDSLKIVSLAR